jgi:hypothetical protein
MKIESADLETKEVNVSQQYAHAAISQTLTVSPETTTLSESRPRKSQIGWPKHCIMHGARKIQMMTDFII